MAGNYWVKLYLDILDDSKMAILPDRLWRRVVELFLLAGRYNLDGDLPTTERLAWDLRTSVTSLEPELIEIEKTGIIRRTDLGWFVVSFSKRQAPVPHAKRQQFYRERIHGDQYAGPGSVPDPFPLSDPVHPGDEIDAGSDSASPDLPIFKLYIDLCGADRHGNIPALIKPQLIAAAEKYPSDRIQFAFKTAAEHNGRSWSYVRAVLENKRNRKGTSNPAWNNPDPEKFVVQERNGNFTAPVPVPAPALAQALASWDRLKVAAYSHGLGSTVEALQPPADADWRLVDDRTAQLREELRKVLP